MHRLHWLALWLVCVLTFGEAQADVWSHYARGADRRAVTSSRPLSLSSVVWVALPDVDDEYIGSSSPVVWDGRVYVHARHYEDFVQVENRIIAYDADDGDEAWSAPIDPDANDSWSTPAVDTRNATVLVASGSRLFAIDAVGGSELWHTDLDRVVTNASPVVSGNLVTGGSPANRVYITDFNPGGSATLYAINVDPKVAGNNPYDPGEIAWRYDSLHGSSGNSPAYRDRVVYVATAGTFPDPDGDLLALDAQTGGVIWSYPATGGFYGGVTVVGNYLYAATYEFSGGQNNSLLYKLRVDTGALVWQVPCERTASIPVVVSGGTILLSGGIDGYGSVVKVQAFDDNGTSATLLWDTYVDSNGSLEVGGWTNQPAYACARLYVGVPPDVLPDPFSSFQDLHVLGVFSNPGLPNFVIEVEPDAGGSSAIAGQLYSFGPGGLFAFQESVFSCAGPGGPVEPNGSESEGK